MYISRTICDNRGLYVESGRVDRPKAALEKRIAEAQTHERSAAIAQIKQLMAEHGLTLADLGGKAAKTLRMQARAKAARCPSSFAIRPAATPGAAAACSPKWLQAQLAQGRKLSDFAV